MSGKMRKRLEEETARDQARMRAWTRRRQEKLERGKQGSSLPGLCRILFIGMIVVPFLCCIGDIRAHWLYPELTSLPLALRNASISALAAWSLFAVPFVICACVQTRRGCRESRPTKRGAAHRGTPRMEPARKYRLQIIVALSGIVLFSLLALLAEKLLPL